MTRILWLSRHNPQEEQLRALRQIFGKVSLIQRIERIEPAVDTGVAQILELMKEEGADEIVCSVPIQLLGGLVKAGVRPVRAIMLRTPSERIDGNGEKEFDFEFLGFERIESVTYQAEALWVR